MDIKELSNLANEVSRRTEIKVSPKDIERLIGAVAKTFNPWGVVDLSDFPVPAVFEAIKVLEKNGYVDFTLKGIYLSSKGKARAKTVHPVADLSCERCGGRGLDPERFQKIRERFIELQASRPEPAHNFDQGFVTPESTLARFLIGYERGDIAGKDILILGDDDLLGIVLGLSGLPKSVTVVEIDPRLVDFIQDTASRGGFEIRVSQFDLRRPLPEEHSAAYDTFFTDPPETLPAADAFVGRGIASLRAPGSAGYFGFTRREASLTKWHNMQKMLLNYGVVFTDIIHNFNEYVNWGYEEDTRAWSLAPVKVLPDGPWYRSALYRIEALEGFRGNKKDYGDQNIYEDKESSTT